MMSRNGYFRSIPFKMHEMLKVVVSYDMKKGEKDATVKNEIHLCFNEWPVK
jgi:hypothetical protein